MKMAKSKVGGGIHSKNVVRKPIREGTSRRQGYHVAGVAQQGQKQGSHVMSSGINRGDTGYRGESIFGGAGYKSQLGNSVALNVGGGGPGKGRTVMACGQQGTHGSVVPGQPAQVKTEIFPGFGPSKGR
jgi:hypothetical protein